jgi:hypothetical protein
MTLTTVPATTPVSTRSAAEQARRLVRFDSLLCLAGGALLVAGAAPLTDLAGVEPLAPTVAAGIFLLLLGAGLAVLVRAELHVLRALLPWSGEGDLLWAAGSVAVAAMVDLTGPGRALVLAQAAVVAMVGIAKLTLSKQLRSSR